MPSSPVSQTDEHLALAQLRELVNRSPEIVRSGDSWPIGAMDPATAKDAAVLLLMGVLDDAPAHRGDCPAVTADLDILLLVRSDGLRHHAGQPALPGGRIDPEDRDEAARRGIPVEQVAALREAVEETGLDAAGVRLLGQLPPIDLPVSNYRVTPVVGWWDLPTPVEAVDINESTLVVRVPVADLLNPVNRSVMTVKRGRRVHRSPAFRVTGDHEPFTIWGFTGNLLSRVFEELGWDEPWGSDHTRKPDA
ncbi:NUDIX hydrolase [Rothia nasisuis]|uniref:NUDIX hydrolase n=1 Tax=Rothia nasisuis TaxID=2109647 RepID=UPI001F2066BA|nr:CoA pyrophosphatase [Rothia nasisuis]